MEGNRDMHNRNARGEVSYAPRHAAQGQAIARKDFESKLIEHCLEKPDFHQEWKSEYRGAENEQFFELAFDYITSVLNAPKGAVFLDAGCGTCAHSLRLARRGYRVQAIDFSDTVLQAARQDIAARGFDQEIALRRENLISLSFPENSYQYVVCWGVLMHIPNVEKAIAELSRVLTPGGMLVISEGNMHSLQGMVLRALKRLLGRQKALVQKTPAGVEHWRTDSTGTIVTREANVPWLIRRFAAHGVQLRERRPGQLTEAYTMVSSQRAKRFLHKLNNFWFRHLRLAGPAYGNILTFQKEK